MLSQPELGNSSSAQYNSIFDTIECQSGDIPGGMSVFTNGCRTATFGAVVPVDTHSPSQTGLEVVCRWSAPSIGHVFSLVRTAKHGNYSLLEGVAYLQGQLPDPVTLKRIPAVYALPDRSSLRV